MSKRKFVLFALVAALVLGFAGSAMAGTILGDEFQWNGSARNGLWDDPANWTKITTNHSNGYPMAERQGTGDAGDTGDTVVFGPDAGTIYIRENDGSGTAIKYTNPLASIEVEDGGQGVVIESEVPINLYTGDGATPNIGAAGAITLDIDSDLTIKAAEGYEDVVYVGVITTNARSVTLDVDDRSKLKFDVPVEFRTANNFNAANSLPVLKLSKGTVEFTKPFWDDGTTGQGPLPVTIRDGIVSVPVTAKPIIGNLTFDANLSVTEASKRFPTLRVTGKGELVWPTGEETTSAAGYFVTPTTNAYIDVVDKDATLSFSQYYNGSTAWAPQFVAATNASTLTTDQKPLVGKIIKNGAGELLFFWNYDGTPDTANNSSPTAVGANNTRLDIEAGTVTAEGADPFTAAKGFDVTVAKDATFENGLDTPGNNDTVTVGSINVEAGGHLKLSNKNEYLTIGKSSVISGDISGKGLFRVSSGANTPSGKTATVELVNAANTYSGGTVIDGIYSSRWYRDRVLIHHEKSLGTGSVFGSGGGTLELSGTDKWVFLDNKIELENLALNIRGDLDISVPEKTVLVQTSGVNFGDYTLNKSGAGDLVLSARGTSGHVGDITGANPATTLQVSAGTATLAHPRALASGPVQVDEGAFFHVTSGLSEAIDNYIWFSADDAGLSVELKDKAVPGVNTLESFRTNNLDFFVRVAPLTKISLSDKYIAVEASKFDDNFNAEEATAVDAWGNDLPFKFTAEHDMNTDKYRLYLTATKDIDFPDVQPSVESVAEASSGDIVFTVSTPNALISADVVPGPGFGKPVYDLAAKKITLPYDTAEAAGAALNVRVYAQTGDTASVAGITVFEDFEIEIAGSGGGEDKPKGAVWTLNGDINDALTELTGTVAFAFDDKPLTTALTVTVSVSDAAGETVGTPVEVTLPANKTDTAVPFTIKAAYKYGTYTLKATTDNAQYDVSNTKSVVKSQGGDDDDDKRGSSGGGCDAGFGLFGLLAATGAVALLRRKG